jgi:hypothetical protein
MAARVINLFEQSARERKAALLALEVESYFRTLRIPELTLATAKGWTQSDWDGIAKMADVNPPSPETQKLVLTLLEARAKRGSK